MSKSPYSQSVVDVGALILRFAKTDRVTLHEDGVRLESDTDHTVMLAVTACALAERLYKNTLDLGKVAQFSIVHDLVEVYSGDVDTFGISEEDRIKKEEAEHEALQRIKKEFDSSLPWIGETIVEYESLVSKEARFVKTVDKCMSKITNILNKGAFFKVRNITEERMRRDYGQLYNKASISYGKDFPELLILMEDLLGRVIKETYA